MKKPKKQARKLCRVSLNISYVVYADDVDMINHAKECVYEDIMSAYKYNEIDNYIDVDDAPDATEDDISDFFIEISWDNEEEELDGE